MAEEVTPRRVQEAVQKGFDRLKNFRNSRLLFLKNFTGQYYDRDHGKIGAEPLNLIFNALSVIVPNLVMNFPKHKVKSKFVAYRGYADLLSMALDQSAKTAGLVDIYRQWIVDSLFTLGILKTGLCDSGTAIAFDDTDHIDPGTVYTELIDFDDFVFDPSARSLDQASFIGHRIRVPRSQILDSGLYQNDLIEQLQSSGTNLRDGSDSLSTNGVTMDDQNDLHDYIDLTEIWVRDADAILTVPGAKKTFDEFLRVSEYYGPKDGPFTFLSFTPPVPNNPMPISSVGIWNDLHVRGNRMAMKIMDQAERQKDLVGYQPGAADDAQEVLDAKDGEAISMANPDGVKTFSFGGQQRSNEAHMSQLMMWFNLVSGNTEALGGVKSDAATATQAQILQANGAIRIEDMKDVIYRAAASEASKRAWYLHTDPLIEVPLIRRMQIPAQYATQQDGMRMMTSPAEVRDVQVTLTPEARQGDFLDYQFDIELQSMSRLDPAMRSQRMMEFAVKVIPAAAMATQACMQMGVAFSFKRFVILMAKEQGLDWLEEVFNDPEFQMIMAEIMMKTPGMQGSQGQVSNKAGQAGQIQNGQPPSVGAVPTNQQLDNQQQQMGAAASQSMMLNNDSY